MQVLVVIGHQRAGSFCHSIAKTAIAELEHLGHTVVFHDLYAEGFDPILRNEEIPIDAPLPPQIRQHCDEVMASGGILVVHPNWWGQPPAMLKGWLDRVFRAGMMYRFGPGGVEGLMGEKRAVVFTTSNTPREAELALYGDPLENLWKNCIFKFCGVKEENFLRRNFESMVLSSPEERAEWIAEVARIVKERFPAE